jgi:hypothetical protein
MSFYGGRPGKSFIIHKVFRHYGEMFEDAQNSKNNEFLDVPENAFVLINYGTPGSEEFDTNKENEELWFEQTQNSRPAVSLGDYNAALWWDFNQPGNYNSTVWLKKYIIEDETEEYRYDYIANIGAIFP